MSFFCKFAVSEIKIQVEIQELLRQYAGHPQIAATSDEKINNLFLQGLNGSGAAMAIASLFTKGGGAFLCLLNDQEEAGYFYHDLNQLTDGNGIYFFPSAYRRAIKYGHIDPANEILRTETLSLLQSPDKPFIIVSYPDALAERVANRKILEENTLSDVLDEYGFEHVDYVYEPGQYAIRGSILDVFSYSCEFPYRIDFFGSEIETIRTFDVETQLSKERLESVYIVPEISKKSGERSPARLPAASGHFGDQGSGLVPRAD